MMEEEGWEEVSDEEEGGMIPPPPPSSMPHFGTQAQQSAPLVIYEATRNFALKPVQPGQLVQCNIVRISANAFFGGDPTFKVTASETNEILMAARKRKKTQTAHYLIGTDLNDLSKDSDQIVKS